MATITIDAYKGWTVAQLKRRCRELCRAVSNDEMIILKLAHGGTLSPVERERVSRLKQAYEEFSDVATAVNRLGVF